MEYEGLRLSLEAKAKAEADAELAEVDGSPHPELDRELAASAYLGACMN